jgi:hypothetical protein
MLWFNADKDAGALRTDDGERIEVPGTAFRDGEKPVGRCAGRIIDFDAEAGAITEIAFVPEVDQRRARLRSRH